MSRLFVTVRSLADESARWESDLGDWHEAVSRGVLIGDSPECDVRLGDDSDGVFAVFFAMSNHQLVSMLDAPVPADRYDGARPHPRRVDDLPFQLEGHELRFGVGPAEGWSARDHRIVFGEPTRDETSPFANPAAPERAAGDAEAKAETGGKLFPLVVLGALAAGILAWYLST